MKPRAASCAVGSELGLLFAFHKSFEPGNPACEAPCPRFYSAVAMTVWYLSSLSACWATAGDFYFPRPKRKDHIVSSAGWGIWSCPNSCVRKSVCSHLCVCLHVISWRMIKWQDELWSMSCRQNTSDLVERESPDSPGPLQATGAGAQQHKEHSVSVRSPQRSPAWALLTSTAPCN